MRNALLVLVAATLLGVVCTLIARSEPGFLLGFFVTIGSVVAALGVRRGAVYLMFPLPAFALFLAAVITGKIHDSSLTSSTTGLGVGFLQWIADVFFPMVIATIAVLVVAGIRWLLAYQLVMGQFSPSADRGSADRGARPDDARPARLPGGPRADRDRWGDPRPPADPRPRDGRPAAPAPAPTSAPVPPRDRAPRPAVRPPWDSRPGQPGQPPRPARPPGPGPRGPWDQR